MEGKRPVPGKPAPIIELTFRGILGLPNSQLELKKIRDDAKQITGALHIRIRNHTTPPISQVAMCRMMPRVAS